VPRTVSPFAQVPESVMQTLSAYMAGAATRALYSAHFGADAGISFTPQFGRDGDRIRIVSSPRRLRSMYNANRFQE
jgi:hypothetical protein